MGPILGGLGGVEARRPIVSDAAHLRELRGKAALCARPDGAVAEAFELAQARAREIVGDASTSWPAAHMTIAGFGTAERPVDPSMEDAFVGVVSRCAEAIPPLQLELTGIDVFAEDRIPYVGIASSPTLSAAARCIRSAAARERLPIRDEIPLEDWEFHLSLGYYAGDRLDHLVPDLKQIQVLPASCVVSELELVIFDGGPERLLATPPLLGRLDRELPGK